MYDWGIPEIAEQHTPAKKDANRQPSVQDENSGDGDRPDDGSQLTFF